MIFSNKSDKQIEYLHICTAAARQEIKISHRLFSAEIQKVLFCFIIFHSYYFFTTPQNTFYLDKNLDSSKWMCRKKEKKCYDLVHSWKTTNQIMANVL